jgi:hypothetical protein
MNQNDSLQNRPEYGSFLKKCLGIERIGHTKSHERSKLDWPD